MEYIEIEIIKGILTPFLILIIGIGGAFIIIPLARNGFLHSKSHSVSKLNYNKIKEFSLDETEISYMFFIKSLKKRTFVTSLFKRFSGKTIKIGRNIYKKDYKSYQFKTNKSIYEKITKDIFKPLSEIKDETMLIQFDEAIHYSLGQVQQFSKNPNLVNLNEEVDRVVSLVKEIKTFTDYIDNAAMIETEKFKVSSMNEVLNKHHIVMDQLTLGVKLFNTNNSQQTEKTNANVTLEKGRKKKKQNNVNIPVFTTYELDNNKDSSSDNHSISVSSDTSDSSDYE